MRRGFNVIELTITLSVIAILSAIVLPRAAWVLDAIERGAVTEIEALFSTASSCRYYARAAQSSLEIDTSKGTIVVRVGADTIQTRSLDAAHGVRLSTTRTLVTYSPTGMGYGAANLPSGAAPKTLQTTLFSPAPPPRIRPSARAARGPLPRAQRRLGPPKEGLVRYRTSRTGKNPANGDARYLLSDHALDGAHHRDLVRRHERERVTGRRRASRSPDAVDVILGLLRHVVVDHVRDAGDVEPALRDVRRDEHADLSRS